MSSTSRPLKLLATVSGNSGVDGLRAAIGGQDLFYPEDIVREIIPAANDTEPEGESCTRALESIVGAGIFSDAKVESYAAPTAPLILALVQELARAHRNRADVSYVLGCGDITNLGGLNQSCDRPTADAILEHLALLPRDVLQQWAEERGYKADIFVIRSGGDEFKYVLKLQAQPPQTAIDKDALQQELRTLEDTIYNKTIEAGREMGIDKIPHQKHSLTSPRAPGVYTAVGLRVIDGKNPNIESMIEDMGADIARIRKAHDQHAPTQMVPPVPAGSIHPPGEKLPAQRTVEATNPYTDIRGFAPDFENGESLMHFSMRLGLKLGGFDKLAESMDFITYDARSRRLSFKRDHPEFEALSDNEKKNVTRLFAAEEMRGLMDPISRCYSSAHADDLARYSAAQGCKTTLTLDLQNFSAMNQISEPYADAILREAGKRFEQAFRETMRKELPGKANDKPAIMRIGGTFKVFVPPQLQQKQIETLKEAFSAALESLGQVKLVELPRSKSLTVELPKKWLDQGVTESSLISEAPAARQGSVPGLTLGITETPLCSRQAERS